MEGLRCPACGDEVIPGHKISLLNETARQLGLFGAEHVSRRRLRRTGTSISVSLDPELLQRLAPGTTAGDEVLVGLQGNKIVIQRG